MSPSVSISYGAAKLFAGKVLTWKDSTYTLLRMRFDGEKLKLLRGQANPPMARRRLVALLSARGVDVTERTIANWEAGQHVPPANVPPTLARIFDVQTDDFFCGEWKDGNTPQTQEVA